MQPLSVMAERKEWCIIGTEWVLEELTFSDIFSYSLFGLQP